MALFSQPSGLVPFLEKRHFTLNQGTPGAVFYFFPAVSRSSSFILRLVPSQLQFSASGGCSIVATPPLRSSSRPKKTRLRCLGVFDSRFHNNIPRKSSTRHTGISSKEKEKNPAKTASIPHFQSVHPELVSRSVPIFFSGSPFVFVHHFCCFSGFLFFSFFFSKIKVECLKPTALCQISSSKHTKKMLFMKETKSTSSTKDWIPADGAKRNSPIPKKQY